MSLSKRHRDIFSEISSKLLNEGKANNKYPEKPITEAAIGAEKPTINDNYLLKKPCNRLNSFEIIMYSCSVSGKVASSSQKSISPKNTIIAPQTKV
jgi:hypothetical protein